MKTIFLFLFIIPFLLSSCYKKTTMKGRIVNPVTNLGIAGIKVYVTKPKTCLGYDGCGSKTIFETESDDEGYFTIEKRFRKSKTYTVSYGYDKTKYGLLKAQVSPAGTEYDGSNFEFYLIPNGNLIRNLNNVSCFDSNDLLTITQIYKPLPDLYGPPYIINYNGCINKTGSNNSVAMGWYVWVGTVTKNGITTPFADSIYVTEGGNHVWDINY